MKALDGAQPAARQDRPATMILHDEENMRIVGFRLVAGQEVPAHRSVSTVMVQVTEGEGVFGGGDGEELRLGPGGTAVFAPGETHSIRAVGDGVRFLAVITPRPV